MQLVFIKRCSVSAAESSIFEVCNFRSASLHESSNLCFSVLNLRNFVGVHECVNHWCFYQRTGFHAAYEAFSFRIFNLNPSLSLLLHPHKCPGSVLSVLVYMRLCASTCYQHIYDLFTKLSAVRCSSFALSNYGYARTIELLQKFLTPSRLSNSLSFFLLIDLLTCWQPFRQRRYTLPYLNHDFLVFYVRLCHIVPMRCSLNLHSFLAKIASLLVSIFCCLACRPFFSRNSICIF